MACIGSDAAREDQTTALSRIHISTKDITEGRSPDKALRRTLDISKTFSIQSCKNLRKVSIDPWPMF